MFSRARIDSNGINFAQGQLSAIARSSRHALQSTCDLGENALVYVIYLTQVKPNATLLAALPECRF
jgi:hypothetical protein